MNDEILLAHLHLYGIEGMSEDWFRSCLPNRRQKVEVTSPNSYQNFFSDWSTLKLGIPQGSILGSVCSLYIYIND